ncbi:MAG: universal stress protein [Cytophagaceae bacterium]
MENRLNILVPVNFTEKCENALVYTSAFLSGYNARIILMNVYTPPVLSIITPIYGISRRERESSKVNLKNRLELYSKSLYRLRPDLEFNFQIEEGEPAKEIVNAVKKYNIDLIIIPTGTGFSRDKYFFGDITWEVLENAQCPVLLVPGKIQSASFKRIVYAANFLPEDLQYLKALISFTKPYSPEISLIHVDDNTDGIKYSSLRFKDSVLSAIPDSDLKFYSVAGSDVEKTINYFIEEHKADLLVMNKRRSFLMESMYHKSVVRKISSSLKLPLLVFHDNDLDQ